MAGFLDSGPTVHESREITFYHLYHCTFLVHEMFSADHVVVPGPVT